MAKAEFAGFAPEMTQFLRQLARNNKRPWFEKNKHRYEELVLQPCLEFIRAFAPRLKKFSPRFQASDKRVGGSLMRIYRDTRFSKDKTPYKTNVGMHFRHEMCGDVHAPGFYVHIAPDECFLGVGVWRPDGPSVKKLRDAIMADPARWKRARDNRKFTDRFELSGESLKTAPRGVPKDHPLIDDLKRKDFCGTCYFEEGDVVDDGFLEWVSQSMNASKPFAKYLCEAMELPF